MNNPLWLSREFNKKCQGLGIEVAYDTKTSRVRFICPKTPSEKVREDLLKEVPSDVKYEWAEELKKTTVLSLDMVFSQLHSAQLLEKASLERPSPHRVKIDLELSKMVTSNESASGMVTEKFFSKDSKAIKYIESLLQKDGWPDFYEIYLNGNEIASFNRVGIEAVSQGKNRSRITKSDVDDLTIALETSGSVEDFLKQLGG